MAAWESEVRRVEVELPMKEPAAAERELAASS